MLDWLLLFAGVNLVMSLAVALPAVAHRPRRPRWFALAGVPALWALLMLGACGYLWATMPPSAIRRGLGDRLIPHGNVDWLLWESRVNAVTALAFWLTVATLLGLVVLWLARRLRLRGMGSVR